MRFGHFAVDFFIVISGFCLMLPVARSGDGKLRGGFRSYIERRARRILPPYYAAVAVAVCLNLVKHVNANSSIGGKAMTPLCVLSHLFLVQNINESWVGAVNPALWSVATEWQIYFLFPLLLLPLWRRSGIALTVAAAFVLGIAPHFVLPQAHNLEWTFPWMLGMFGVGMLTALIVASPLPQFRILRESVPWGAVAFGVFALFCGLATFRASFVAEGKWACDPLFGCGAAALIAACAMSSHRTPGRRRPAVVALLESAPLSRLGAFSYSLYLMHLPAWWLILPLVKAFHLTGLPRFLFQVSVGVPFCLLFSYMFYLAVERQWRQPAHERDHVACLTIPNARVAPSHAA
jgi:peptidoglycan/LPS O-acetylase OafA/YrhL